MMAYMLDLDISVRNYSNTERCLKLKDSTRGSSRNPLAFCRDLGSFILFMGPSSMLILSLS
jgi:hypothetical protein